MPPRIEYEIEGRTFSVPLDGDQFTIGRHAGNDVVIDHPWISRRHAMLFKEGETWRVRDLGSLNGTRINELGHADAPLRDGDRIFLYKFPVTFRAEARPRVALTTAQAGETDPVMHTVIQDAVDFSALAARQQDVRRFQRLLTIVTRASESIVACATPEQTFDRVLDLVFEHLNVERGLIMVRDEEKDDLVARCVRGRGASGGAGAEIRFSRTIADKVFQDKVAILTQDAQADRRFSEGASVFELGIRSAIAAPLWHGDRVEGLIYVDTMQRGSFDDFDLDLLSALGNHVAVALEQSRLQDSLMEQRLMRRRLERYHSPAVVELITAGGGGPDTALVADEREVTVLFADVVGFTRRCEEMPPREIAELLNRYFSAMTGSVFEHQGTVDKFIGDCLMAVFGAPLESKDHAARAVEAALDMRDALRRLNEPLSEEQQLRFRVGMHSGWVVAGDIGSEHRTDYTVLGATVNLAARLEAAVAEPGQIVLTEETRRAIRDRYRTRFLGEHRLKGISEPVRCYELLGRGG